MKTIHYIILALTISLISSVLTGIIILKIENSENSLIEKFYSIETAVYVSPHSQFH